MTSETDAEQKLLSCVKKSVDVISYSRNCRPLPYVNIESSLSKDKSEEYVNESLRHKWRHDLYSTLSLSVYIRDNSRDDVSLNLLERWTFQCLRGGHEVTNGQRSGLSRRIGILIRSMYCYVRMLPAFHLSKSRRSSFVFKFDCNEAADGTTFTNEFSFPRLPAPSIGFLLVKVSYFSAESITRAPRIRLSQLQRIPSSSSSASSPRIGSPSRNASLPMPIPDASGNRHRAGSSSAVNTGQPTEAGVERPRSLDSNPLYLQEGFRNNEDSLRKEAPYTYSPASISPIGITPPFSCGILSKTPEAYAMSLLRQRDGIPPLPSNSLLSTSPQQLTPMVDISMLRNKFLLGQQQSNIIGIASEGTARSFEKDLHLSELPISPFAELSSVDSSALDVRSTSRSRFNSFEGRQSGGNDTMLLLTDDLGLNADRKSDDFVEEVDDVFEFEEDMPFACGEKLFSKSQIEGGDKRSSFSHTAYLEAPPLLQSFQNKDEDELDASQIKLRKFKEFQSTFSEL